MNGFKLALCGVLLSASSVAAEDLILSPSPPVVQRAVTYYGAPAVVAQPAPAPTYYVPAPAPTTSYYAPPPATVVAPAPVPVTTYYAPAVVVPRPVVTYYAPAVAVPVTTYYAPAPAAVTTYYAPAPVPVVVPAYGVVRSKVYYPGEPVRNFFKALAP